MDEWILFAGQPVDLYLEDENSRTGQQRDLQPHVRYPGTSRYV